MTARADALLFDLGGVLIEVDFCRAIAAWADAAGVDASRLAPRFRRDAAFCAHESGAIDDAEYFSALRKSLEIDLSDAEMLSGWNAIFGEPIPGMESLLGRLTGKLPVYIFSNTNPAHIVHWKPRYRSLLAGVREVICSCEIGCRKPDPAAFLKVTRRMGVPPSAIGFFDDLEENVEGARAAGLQAFRVSSASDVRKALPQIGIELGSKF